MSKNCEHIEELLPGFAEGDLTREQKALVNAHVHDCEACAESLAFFTQLETSLHARRALLPAPTRTVRRVAHRLGMDGTSGMFSVFRGLPAAISSTLVVAGIVLLFVTTPLQQFVGRIVQNRSIETSSTIRGLESVLNQIAGLGEFTLMSAYCGIFGLVLLAGSWMVLRYVRE